MTPEEYRQLYELLFRYQQENIPSGNTYKACDTLLNRLYPLYHNQQKEQCR